MKDTAQPLIQSRGSRKEVFYTDEIETHALSGIHLSVNQGGEYVADRRGLSGCGKSTLLSIYRSARYSHVLASTC